jgi:cobalt-zinc-cadmium efflux system outer membrane protein
MELGLSAEREEGTWTFGPSFAVRLPLFSGTEVRRRRADYLRAQQALAVQAVEIRAEVRAARERLLAARERVAHYRDVLLPLTQRIVRLVQREYNFMLSSPFDLLDARRAEIAAQREHISALGDYWIARVQLQAAIGEKLASTTGEN